MDQPDNPARGIFTKRWIRWAALALAIGIVILGLLFAWYAQVKGSAERYAQQATSDVTRDWAADDLTGRATAGLARTPRESLERYLAFIKSQLGSLTGVRSAEATGGTLSVGGLAVTVRVVAEFEKGQAKVSWLLVREGGSWKVASVTFDSDQIRLPVPSTASR